MESVYVIIQFVIRGPLIKGQYGYKIMKSITLKLESGLEKAKVNMYYNIFSVLQGGGRFVPS